MVFCVYLRQHRKLSFRSRLLKYFQMFWRQTKKSLKWPLNYIINKSTFLTENAPRFNVASIWNEENYRKPHKIISKNKFNARYPVIWLFSSYFALFCCPCSSKDPLKSICVSINTENHTASSYIIRSIFDSAC